MFGLKFNMIINHWLRTIWIRHWLKSSSNLQVALSTILQIRLESLNQASTTNWGSWLYIVECLTRSVNKAKSHRVCGHANHGHRTIGTLWLGSQTWKAGQWLRCTLQMSLVPVKPGMFAAKACCYAKVVLALVLMARAIWRTNVKTHFEERPSEACSYATHCWGPAKLPQAQWPCLNMQTWQMIEQIWPSVQSNQCSHASHSVTMHSPNAVAPMVQCIKSALQKSLNG